MAEIFSETTDVFGNTVIVWADETGVHLKEPIVLKKEEIRSAGGKIAAVNLKMPPKKTITR